MSYIIKDTYQLSSDIYYSVDLEDERTNFIKSLNANEDFKIIGTDYNLCYFEEMIFDSDLIDLMKMAKSTNSYVIKINKNDDIWTIKYHRIYNYDTDFLLLTCLFGHEEPKVETFIFNIIKNNKI